MSTDTTKESSAALYRRLTAKAIANADGFPIRMGWYDDPVVARLDMDLQGLTFLRDCVEAHAPMDGAAGEVGAVLARVLEMLEAESD